MASDKTNIGIEARSNRLRQATLRGLRPRAGPEALKVEGQQWPSIFEMFPTITGLLIAVG
jgi:hypothetical protein